jgi:hypothetical protein
MIKQAQPGKEIVVTVVNKIGALADISKLLADSGVNIEAVAGYAADKEAKIMLITNDDLRSIEALKKAGYKSFKENEVVVVELEDEPGALKDLTARLTTQGIDIKQIYGTTCSGGCPAKLIISTSDNEKALAAFNK